MSKARSYSEDNIIYEISSNYNNLEFFNELDSLNDYIAPEPFVTQKAMPAPLEQIPRQPKIDLNIKEILKDKPDGESIEITKFIFKFVFYKINDIYIKETYLIKDNIVDFIGYEQEKN
jgi:hypothetical protein